MRKTRRKTMLVDRPMQKRFVQSISRPWMFAMAACTILVSVFIQRVAEEALEHQVRLPSLIPLFVAIGLLVVATTVFVLLSAYRLSHRVAGPAYRIRTTIREFMEGDQKARIRLRRNDFLDDVAASVNQLFEHQAPSEDATPSVGLELSQEEEMEPVGAH